MASPEISQKPQENPIDMEREYDFDGGNFTLILANTPQGFNIETDKSLLTFDDNLPHPFSKKNPLKNDNGHPFMDALQQERFKGAIQGQLSFTGGKQAGEAFDAFRKLPGSKEDSEALSAFWEKMSKKEQQKAHDEIKALAEATVSAKLKAFVDYLEKRNRYITRSEWMYGIRNIRIIREKGKETIKADTRPVFYPFYDVFANSEVDPSILDSAENLATAGGLITKDNKLMIQIRSKGNGQYGGILGAGGGAGGLSAKKDVTPQDPKDGISEYRQGRRTMAALSTEIANRSNLREMEEETGLTENDLEPDTHKIIGIAHEKKLKNLKVHKEFLYMSRSKLTADEVIKKASQAADNIKLDPEEFREKFAFIDATPEAIENLLVHTRSPFPPTHEALYTGIGYILARELENAGAKQKGYADSWKERVQIGLNEKKTLINKIVSEYYERNPNAVTSPPIVVEGKVNQAIEKYKSDNPNASSEELQRYVEIQRSQLLQFKRDPKGYHPSFTGAEQGLPEPSDALEEIKDRIGLLKAA